MPRETCMQELLAAEYQVHEQCTPPLENEGEARQELSLYDHD